ncbi:MAG: M43 family zinc metalloprotease, partial [Flavisolibacter sp.]
MRTILSGICLLLSSLLFAQKECANSAYIEQQKSLDPSFANKLSQVENFITAQQRLARENGQQAPSVIVIPVVVHVLYKTAAQNISDDQIKSQLDALNRDFRRKNADTVNTPARFKSVAADVQIEFQLATADPGGRATTGIIRKYTNTNYWTTDDKIKFSSEGGDDAWDSRYYLNLWVGDLMTLLGYSSLPGASAQKDGVVINYTAFGTLNISGPYNMGRTATHEVGHWLGLKHIWGDSYCGNDYVDDTPVQGNYTTGCPTTFISTCNNGPLGDMYMNYMDFTNDACMNLFTTGQKERMLVLFKDGGPRNLLLSSTGLNKPWVTDSPLPSATTFKLYPNPTKGELVLDFQYDSDWIGSTVSIVNLNGMTISKFLVTSKVQQVDVSKLPAGMYFIKAEKGSQKLRDKFIKL